jgi:hypothetical protein
MSRFLATYGPIIATVALVMAFARTGPEEARSKLSEWADLFGLTKASRWLSEHTLDRQVLRCLAWVMGGLIFIGGTAFGFWLQPQLGPSSPVYPPFAPVYDEFHRTLNSPIDISRPAAVSPADAKHSAGMYFFEHSDIIIWIQQKRIFYRIKHDRTWEPRPHAIETSDSKWWTDDYVRQTLDLPTNKKSPVGGIAAEWAANPVDWDWLGSMDWQCPVNGRDVYSQKFADGLLIGPLPIKEGSDAGQIFVLFDNGKWESRRAALNEKIQCFEP